MTVRTPILSALAMLVASMSAHAGTSPTPVPEPGTWALVALAAVIGVAVSRNRRK